MKNDLLFETKKIVIETSNPQNYQNNKSETTVDNRINERENNNNNYFKIEEERRRQDILREEKRRQEIEIVREEKKKLDLEQKLQQVQNVEARVAQMRNQQNQQKQQEDLERKNRILHEQEERDALIAQELYMKELSEQNENNETNENSYTYTRDDGGEHYIYNSNRTSTIITYNQDGTENYEHQHYEENINNQNEDTNTNINIDNVNLESYEEVSRLTEMIGSVKTGLPDEKLSILPNFILKKQYNIDYEEKCSICFDNWVINQKLTRLNCFHLFHTECIKTWLKEKRKCPICNYEVIF